MLLVGRQMKPWDIFISHASDDKEAFVDPLARRLKQLAVRVWYDQFVLLPGDRLSEKIAEGLAKSRCGLLVISHSFIRKRWTRYEMSGLVNRFVEDNARLIPIWLDVTRTDVVDLSPALADLVSIRATEHDVNSCALEILRVVRPQLHENLSMLAQVDSGMFIKKKVPRRNLKDGPIRHHDLPESLLVRIQNIWFATRDLIPGPLSKAIENFQRDLRPEREVEVWERIISALQIVTDIMKTDAMEVKREAFTIFLYFCDGSFQSVFDETAAGKFNQAITAAAAQAWLQAVPKVTVSDVDAKEV
jgi:TIR domain